MGRNLEARPQTGPPLVQGAGAAADQLADRALAMIAGERHRAHHRCGVAVTVGIAIVDADQRAVVICLRPRRFVAAIGQMHMYCNYAKEHWAYPEENPPVGLILCADKGLALARYALEGLPTKVMAANYRMVLPDTDVLQKELESTRLLLESRGTIRPKTWKR